VSTSNNETFDLSETFPRKPRPSGSGPVALIILDGFGLRNETVGNAVAQAKKPNYDKILATFPHTTLIASGEEVGLPEGQFGNSEVGHSNIGAGRVLYQELTRLNREIATGSLYVHPILKSAMMEAKRKDVTLHLCGLVSNGGVHAHIRHLQALLRMAAGLDVPNVVVHAFLDGRDTAPTTGHGFLSSVQETMTELGVGKLGTVTGRYYAMDRDNRWERTSLAYNAMVHGEGTQVHDALSAITQSYADGVTDEFVKPLVCVDEQNEPIGLVADNDVLLFFNFRPDRAIQLSLAFTDATFDGFDRGVKPPHVRFISMTKYSEKVGGEIAYPPTDLTNTLGEVLASHGLTQLRIAETEKYPHVTFFFSGGREQPFPGEERVLIPSPKVATYDLQPEMSASGVASAASERLRSGEIDVMILNFANPDMVGHTGSLPATIAAIEAVDACLGTVLDALESQGGTALVTADHGNADIMIDPETGGPCTTHTTNPVPLIITKAGLSLHSGVLADLAPTMLDLLGVERPQEMSGQSLID
jgi:2,3-bisphosphoglycerate-independent phosphoglycerate mutase